MTAGRAVEEREAGREFENVRLYVSAAGPRFWIVARKAVGSCAPLNGTVNERVGRDRQRDARLAWA